MSHMNGAGPDPPGLPNPFATTPPDPAPDLICVGCGEVESAARRYNEELRAEWEELRAKEIAQLERIEELRAEGEELDAELAAACFPLMGVEHLGDLGPPEWLIDDVVPEGNVVVFGQPGTYKSFVTLDMALCVASGQDWHGHPVKQGNVVYVAAEGIRGMKRRVDAWLEHHDLTPADVADLRFVGEAVNLLDPDAARRIWNTLEVLIDQPVELLVVDTMARSMVGGDENSAKDVGLFLHELSNLPAATRLVVHHTGKNGESERGSGALRGAADMMARVDREGQAPRIELVCDKPPKDGEQWPTVTFERELVGDSLVLKTMSIFQAKAEAQGERSERILEWLVENGPASQNAIVRGVGGKATLVRETLRHLDQTGQIVESKRGQRKTYSLPRPTLGDAVGTRWDAVDSGGGVRDDDTASPGGGPLRGGTPGRGSAGRTADDRVPRPASLEGGTCHCGSLLTDVAGQMVCFSCESNTADR